MHVSAKELRQDAEGIYRAALKAVDPYILTLRYADLIRTVYHNGNYHKLLLVAFGKAAYPMAKAVSDIAVDLPIQGVVITKYGHTPRAAGLNNVKIYEAAHPVPDNLSVQATEKVLEILKNADRRTLVVCLISGGGSSLLVAPQQGISLADKQETTRLLLNAGANIQELNAVRKHISAIKGGRLAETAFPAGILSLILSDVIGDPLDVIASGPTTPDPTTFQDALNVIGRYHLTRKIPVNVLDILQRGCTGEIPETPKAGNQVFTHVQNIVIGGNMGAIEAARTEAIRRGYEASIVSATLQGEARLVGASLAQQAVAALQRLERSSSKRICMICGGETTVTVGGRGLGGRNMELALAFAKEAAGAEGIALLSAGTDGTDGPTDAAGAFADAKTISMAAARGLSPDAYLEENDSYNFFKAIDGLFITGPTGVNVMDIQIILIEGDN